MFADPKLIPATRGCTAAVVAPPAMNTLEGETVTLDASLLLRATYTPPVGAGFVRVTGKVTDWLGPTLTLTGNVTAPELDAVFANVKTAGVDTPATEAKTV